MESPLLQELNVFSTKEVAFGELRDIDARQSLCEALTERLELGE